jgi:hypothetical protein
LISYKQFVYLFCSIQSFLRALGCFIPTCQEQHINKTRIVVTPFNILTNLHYKKVKFVKDKTIIRSSKVGLGRVIKKSHVFTSNEEKLMFNQTLCQENSPLSVNMHLPYFCTQIFFIWATTKF